MPYTHDESRYPILITAFVGETTVPEALAYNAWLDVHVERARKRGARLAIIVDATAVTRTRPDVRKAFSSRPPSVGNVVAGTWVVSNSALMRGVVAAISWLNPKVASVRMTSTLGAAIEAATTALKPASRKSGESSPH